MKPVDQTKLYDPPTKGNCMSAALASILELNIEDIPHFEDMKSKRYPELLRWLEKMGFHLLEWDREIYLPGYFIANGPSPRGIEHSVVYKGTKMVHDPHPSRAGLEKIRTVWALLPLNPAPYVKHIQLNKEKI